MANPEHFAKLRILLVCLLVMLMGADLLAQAAQKRVFKVNVSFNMEERPYSNLLLSAIIRGFRSFGDVELVDEKEAFFHLGVTCVVRKAGYSCAVVQFHNVERDAILFLLDAPSKPKASELLDGAVTKVYSAVRTSPLAQTDVLAKGIVAGFNMKQLEPMRRNQRFNNFYEEHKTAKAPK
jgi:hypothetical protein